MLTCKKPDQVKDCPSCGRHPMNQIGKAAGQPITPTPRNGQCPGYVMRMPGGDK